MTEQKQPRPWTVGEEVQVGTYWVRAYVRPTLWQLCDGNKSPFGQFHDSFESAEAKALEYTAADAEDDSSNWYVGCEWNSDLMAAEYPPEGGEGSVVFHNSDGPGSAKRRAKELYDKLCKEPGGFGDCYYGRVDGATGEELDAEEVCERDPQQEEEDRQAAYERYLEDNHDAIVQQERYEAWRAEY